MYGNGAFPQGFRKVPTAGETHQGQQMGKPGDHHIIWFGKGLAQMSESVQIILIICLTIVALAVIDKGKHGRPPRGGDYR